MNQETNDSTIKISDLENQTQKELIEEEESNTSEIQDQFDPQI